MHLHVALFAGGFARLLREAEPETYRPRKRTRPTCLGNNLSQGAGADPAAPAGGIGSPLPAVIIQAQAVSASAAATKATAGRRNRALRTRLKAARVTGCFDMEAAFTGVRSFSASMLRAGQTACLPGEKV